MSDSGDASNAIHHFPRELYRPRVPDAATGGPRAGVGEDYPEGRNRAFLFPWSRPRARCRCSSNNSASAFDLDEDVVIDGVSYGLPLGDLAAEMKDAGDPIGTGPEREDVLVEIDVDEQNGDGLPYESSHPWRPDMAQAHEAKVVTRLIQEDKFLAPLKSKSFKWKIDQTNVWWFHAVPRNNQTSYPQTVKIDEVRISAEKSSSSAEVKFFATVKVTNLTPPNPPDFPHEDGCHYDLYVAVASPI